jgi:triphosphoribosyl-dephospho-CoA synthetase
VPKNKPRGNQDGLKKNREDTKVQNTEAMWKVIIRLRKQKAHAIWTHKEVWSGAGLKSNVALKSPWNRHIKETIEEHNKEIRENAEIGPAGYSQRKTLRATNKALRQEILALKKQREQALNLIAIWEAEADQYKKECEQLEKVNERLSKKVDSLTAQKKPR